MSSRWSNTRYLTVRNAFINNVAGCIRVLEIDTQSRIDSFRLAACLYDYIWFHAAQTHGIVFTNHPTLNAGGEQDCPLCGVPTLDVCEVPETGQRICPDCYETITNDFPELEDLEDLEHQVDAGEDLEHQVDAGEEVLED